ncbi:hypothetical protein J6590_008522 [Homalodisca vitripennis]|nr:hypothetical protein J6590_008522 [Homalodisca vitripennis]
MMGALKSATAVRRHLEVWILTSRHVRHAESQGPIRSPTARHGSGSGPNNSARTGRASSPGFPPSAARRLKRSVRPSLVSLHTHEPREQM